MTTVAELVVGADPDAWRAVGFDVDAEGVVQLGGIRVRLCADESGLVSWVLADAPDSSISTIDGLVTRHGQPSPEPGGEHPNGVYSIDHVVVYTHDLERTCDAIAAATGAPLKRIREVGSLRQGFHRLGELIVEVVTFPQVEGEQASFWGLAVNAREVDSLHDRLGDDVISAAKDAVQQGRRIASFRVGANLGLPVAVMA